MLSRDRKSMSLAPGFLSIGDYKHLCQNFCS
ncbi:hypothetical protein F383_02052 [Gossypium arboreum]|uniref:Uncharacterized protein n=1 Tax=Gossypium arboreum TaxID=29729 RepID=A0A0B0N0Q8_GOSAR|nr:hypothetical protein F383_06699 [Gossypium arboreum]KHG23232.1 hypothetical protein F383_02052 [Gossypium arboreum]